MTRKRILVIDDEPAIREVIQSCLEELAGWEVITASGGQEGLAIAVTEQPDAILLDSSMPDLSGEETYRQLQDNPTTRSIPVAFLTGKTHPREQAQFGRLGVTRLILKPFSPITLVDEIAQQFGWRV